MPDVKLPIRDWAYIDETPDQDWRWVVPWGDSDTHFLVLGTSFAETFNVPDDSTIEGPGNRVDTSDGTPIYQYGYATAMPGTDKIIVMDASGVSSNSIDYRVYSHDGLTTSVGSDESVYADYGSLAIGLTSTRLITVDLFNYGSYRWDSYDFDGSTLTWLASGDFGYWMNPFFSYGTYQYFLRIDDTRYLHIYEYSTVRIIEFSPDGLSVVSIGTEIYSANGYTGVYPDIPHGKVWMTDDNNIFTPYNIPSSGTILTAGTSLTTPELVNGSDNGTWISKDGSLFLTDVTNLGSFAASTVDGSFLAYRDYLHASYTVLYVNDDTVGFGDNHNEPGFHNYPINDRCLFTIARISEDPGGTGSYAWGVALLGYEDIGVSLLGIVVKPTNEQVVYLDGTLQLHATGFYDDDSTTDLTSSVTWPDLLPWASIDANGLLTAYDRHTFDAGDFQATYESFSDFLPRIDIVPNSEVVVTDLMSTAPHGLYFVGEIIDNVTNLTLKDPNTDTWEFKLVNEEGFQPGDIIYGSSEYKDKFLLLVRGNSAPISIIGKVLPGSIWPLIFPGENRFVWSPSSVRWKRIWHMPAYRGV